MTFSILFYLLWSTSCRKDFEYAPSFGNLSFSQDTVYLDTVFSNIGSSTYTLKVYNPTRDDVIIPNISLKNGSESFYRLNVDGVAGKEFKNIPIYAQDSLFILIETTIAITDNSNKELLYTDAILFDVDPYQQSVALVTLAKDAIFLYPKLDTNNDRQTIVLYTDNEGNPIEVTGFELQDQDLRFTNDKSYVIYGYGIVPSGKELRIDAGARVFFHKDSGIFIQNDASINVNGKLSTDKELLEGEVIFEGDRLEPAFEAIPGQWGGLWISNGSTGNYLEYLTIKNATIGLFVEASNTSVATTLTIKNSQLYNNSRHNIWSKNSSIMGENLVLGGAGDSSLLCENGGNYSFTHCTIANYWTNGFRNSSALELRNNSFIDEGQGGSDLIKADFKNCIIDGSNKTEITLVSNEINTFNFNFQNCLLKFNQSQSNPEADNLYDFTDSASYIDIILNGTSDFFLPKKNDFRIGLDSDAINMGDLDAANTVSVDLLGLSRTGTPDVGAYQAIELKQ